MATDNRDFDFSEDPERDPAPREKPPQQAPKVKRGDNVIPFRRARGASATHDPSVDYEPPNPFMVLPRSGIATKLLGLLIGLVLFAALVWLIFHDWMMPGARHPGQQKQTPGLEQKLP